jgi:integrase
VWRLKLYRGKWCAVSTINGKSKRISLGTEDREEAERRFHDFVEYDKRPTETVSEILDAWQKDRKHLKSQDTITYSIQALKPYFGHFRPDQVTKPLCRQYAKFRKKKPGTVRRELEVLRAALYWQDKHTKADVELPPAAPPKERYLTRDEYEKLLEAATSPHIELFIILALSTAARASALLDLTWDRVDFKRGQIQLSKGEETNKRRALVPMTKRAREALEKAYKARETDFVIEYGGEQVKTVIKGFKRTAKKAGMNDVTPHVLRHTAAVWMAEAGVPMSEISQFLGHTSTQVTERVYARYSPEYLRNAAAALE